MIFTTYWYLLFAVATIVVYWALPLPTLRLGFLGLACLVFHAHFAGPAGMAPIMVLMVITYLAGFTRNKGACIAAMLICVLTLCFYKYAFFLIANSVAPVNPVLGARLHAAVQSVMPGMPPLGISFFAFEFVHYLFEVKRGGEPIRNPLKFLLFSIFFPSLVAGPIKRYTQFLGSLEEGCRRFVPANVAEGLWRIGTGFLKKLLIADNLTFLIDQAHPTYANYGLLGRWIFVAALALRILADFSGYSDIAIGFARLLGVRLPENFNWPYLAKNLQDFWQRWHISLSSWIRDYVYIPLGGSRYGTPRRIANGLIAFALCGLWHGAAWNFVVWGLLHGVGLALCATYREIPGIGPFLGKIFDKEPLAAWALTQVYAAVGWLFFFYPVGEAWHMTQLLFGK